MMSPIATKTVARLETHAAQGVLAYFGGVGSDLHAAGATIAEKTASPISELGSPWKASTSKATAIFSRHSGSRLKSPERPIDCSMVHCPITSVQRRWRCFSRRPTGGRRSAATGSPTERKRL